MTTGVSFQKCPVLDTIPFAREAAGIRRLISNFFSFVLSNSISKKQLRGILSGKGIVEQLFKYQIPPKPLVEEW